MRITETLHGRTVEDVRRNVDGSVTLYCDSGHSLTLEVVDNEIQVRTEKIRVDAATPVDIASKRMNLLQAFQGHMVNYVTRNDDGSLFIECEPLKHNTQQFEKQLGRRTIHLTHANGRIDELPPVGAKIGLPSLSMSGAQGS